MVSTARAPGSDAFIYKVTGRILEVQDKATRTRQMLDNNRTTLIRNLRQITAARIRKAE